MAGASRVTVTRSQSLSKPQGLRTTIELHAAVIGVTERGAFGGVRCLSLDDFKAKCGWLTSNAQVVPLWVKTFFDDGGQILDVFRMVHWDTQGDPSTKASVAAELATPMRNAANDKEVLGVAAKTDGTYAHAIRPRITAASSGKATEFNFAVVDSVTGLLLEPEWTNVSMDPTAPNYVVKAVNIGTVTHEASNLVTVEDLTDGEYDDLPALSPRTTLSGGDITNNNPADAGALTVTNTTGFPTAGTVLIDSEEITYTGKTGTTLTGIDRGANGTIAAAHTAATAKVILLPARYATLADGDDGLTGLSDDDYIGALSDDGATGFRTLDQNKEIEAVAMPDRTTIAAQIALIDYCETVRNGAIFPVLDCPPLDDSDEPIDTVKKMRNYVTQNGLELKERTENGVIYWPRILVDNPSQSIFGPNALIPAPYSGALMATYARSDRRGVGAQFEQPAGTVDGVIRSAKGLEYDDTKNDVLRGQLWDDLVNPLHVKDGVVYADGARTLRSTGNFSSVGASRGVLFVGNRCREGLDPIRHKNMSKGYFAALNKKIDTFLRAITDEDRFATKVYEEAFYVDTGESLNNAASKKRKTSNVVIGLALTEPGEFINIEIKPFGV